MKKFIISTTMLLACVLMFSNCAEEDYDERYKNPSQTSDIAIEKLMPGTLIYSIDWIMSTYGRFFGWEIQNLCKQANTIGVRLYPGRYYNIWGYTDGLPPYGNLTKMITGYKLMESLYKELSDAEKAENEVYMLAVETMMYGMTAYIMSSFGDIPFDEVGAVAGSGSPADSHPHFQDDKELYKRILDKLDELNTKFKSARQPSLFKAQDFICHGDLMAWRRLTNSLRLRIALLVSTQGDLTAEGQNAIKQILEDPTGRPIIEDNSQMIVYTVAPEGSGSQLAVHGGSGFDWVYLHMASGELIARMQKNGNGGVWVAGQDDPRVPIFFSKATLKGDIPVDRFDQEKPALPDTVNASGEFVDRSRTSQSVPTVYRGSSNGMEASTFDSLYQNNFSAFSRIREYGFFRNNWRWDPPVLTAAEIWFIKAEAYQRGWVVGDAKAAFKKAVKLSLDFYFDRHKNKTSDEATAVTGEDAHSIIYRAVTNPDLSIYTDTWIDNFAEARWTKRPDESTYAGGPLEAILEQKWLNFGYVYAGEQWNDLRRTGYPRMLYLKDRDPAAEIPFPRNRNRYTDSDRNYNMNFPQVASQDNYSDVLFWAKADWHDGPTWP